MSYGSGNSKVTLDLEHLGLIPVAVPSHFTIRVAGGDDAELAVSVQGKHKTANRLGFSTYDLTYIE